MGSYILMLNSSQVVFLLFYLEYICISQTFASGAHAPVTPKFHNVVTPWPLSHGFYLISLIFPTQLETRIG
jgi:hypothetical protein